MSAVIGLTGNWLINDGSRAYSARLVQLGTRVSGVYDQNQGKIDGNVDRSTVQIRWDQPGNRRAGNSELIIAADGKSMTGMWSYDPMAYGSGLSGGGQWTFTKQGESHDAELQQFYQSLKARLRAKRYQEIQGGSAGDLFFIKPAGGLSDTTLIAVIDARSISESVNEIFGRLKNWFQQAAGGPRAQGLLLLVYSNPSAHAVDEVKQAKLYAGNISVDAFAYDLNHHTHWSSYSGLEGELFGP
jgi:hypothetical protein